MKKQAAIIITSLFAQGAFGAVYTCSVYGNATVDAAGNNMLKTLSQATYTLEDTGNGRSQNIYKDANVTFDLVSESLTDGVGPGAKVIGQIVVLQEGTVQGHYSPLVGTSQKLGGAIELNDMVRGLDVECISQ